jgi:hypothetical protein
MFMHSVSNLLVSKKTDSFRIESLSLDEKKVYLQHRYSICLLKRIEEILEIDNFVERD